MCHMQQHNFVGQSRRCVDKPPLSWEGGLAGTEEPGMKAEPEALPDGQGNYSEARAHFCKYLMPVEQHVCLTGEILCILTAFFVENMLFC